MTAMLAGENPSGEKSGDTLMPKAVFNPTISE